MRSQLHFDVCLCLLVIAGLPKPQTRAADWPMLGRDGSRNAVSLEKNPPLDWSIDTEKEFNIKWKAKLGHMTFGSPIVAGGKVFIGTNDFGGHVKREPDNKRWGCLLCFREADGKFLWHHSAKKPDGIFAHFMYRGLGSSPLVEGNRLWLVSNRWEVLCLDTEGFHDKENDGPFVDESTEAPYEADIVWRYDLRKKLKVFPYSHIHYASNRQCSPVSYRNRIYVVTGNGAASEDSSLKIPSPDAPSLVCFDKNTGKVLWTDSSPGGNILMGQFSSPLIAEIDGRAQVIVGQGDGWVRSFDALTGKLIWKFDINPKESWWLSKGRRGKRYSILATPVFYKGWCRSLGVP